jgi:hypothetical protein
MVDVKEGEERTQVLRVRRGATRRQVGSPEPAHVITKYSMAFGKNLKLVVPHTRIQGDGVNEDERRT